MALVSRGRTVFILQNLKYVVRPPGTGAAVSYLQSAAGSDAQALWVEWAGSSARIFCQDALRYFYFILSK